IRYRACRSSASFRRWCHRASVARIERSEIRDRPVNTATLPPGFAGAQPGLRSRHRENSARQLRAGNPMSEREDLVLAYRILAAHGVVDAYGHVSLRTAKNPNRYLLARAMAPELVTTDDILEFDLDSNPVKDVKAALYLERYIHGEIFKRRPDINAVVHNHSPSVIPFGVTTVPLRPLFNTGAF